MKSATNQIHPLLLPVLGVVLALVPTAGTEAQQVLAERNRNTVRSGFEKWSSGTGSFFDLLSDTVQWQITGSTSYSKLYPGKQQFMNDVIIPLNDRLSQKIRPTVRALFADGDWVIALWDGQATTIDGKPYNMSYSWYMQIRDDKVVNVIAFLDGMQFNEAMKLRLVRK